MSPRSGKGTVGKIRRRTQVSHREFRDEPAHPHVRRKYHPRLGGESLQRFLGTPPERRGEKGGVVTNFTGVWGLPGPCHVCI